MTLRRGDIWSLQDYPRPVLVISGGMYNDQPAIRTVLAMPIVDAESPGAWTVPVGDGEFAMIDRLRPYRKNDLVQRRRRIDTQTLTEVNNLLFKILATE